MHMVLKTEKQKHVDGKFMYGVIQKSYQVNESLNNFFNIIEVATINYY